MAGIRDIIGTDPVQAAQMAAQDRIRRARKDADAAFATSLGGMTAAQAQGASTGKAISDLLGGFFGEDEAEQVEASPEVQEARKNALLVEQLGTIEADPTSAEYARQAGTILKNAGREAQALDMAATAAERDKAETAAAAKAAKAARDEELASLKALPPVLKSSVIESMTPKQIMERWNTSEAGAKKLIKDAGRNKETALAKQAQAVSKLNTVRPVDVSGTDIKRVTTALEGAGFSPKTFNPTGIGSDEETFKVFSNKLTGQAMTEQRLLSERGINKPLEEIVNDILANTEADGVFSRDPNFFGSGWTVAEELDPAKLNANWKQRIEDLQVPQADAPAAPEAKPEVIKLF